MRRSRHDHPNRRTPLPVLHSAWHPFHSQPADSAMKTKEHRFILVVKSSGSRKEVQYAVLTAFASREPDGHEFDLKRSLNTEVEHKRVWLDGAKAGAKMTVDLILPMIEKVKNAIGKTPLKSRKARKP